MALFFGLDEEKATDFEQNFMSQKKEDCNKIFSPVEGFETTK